MSANPIYFMKLNCRNLVWITSRVVCSKRSGGRRCSFRRTFLTIIFRKRENCFYSQTFSGLLHFCFVFSRFHVVTADYSWSDKPATTQNICYRGVIACRRFFFQHWQQHSQHGSVLVNHELKLLRKSRKKSYMILRCSSIYLFIPV